MGRALLARWGGDSEAESVSPGTNGAPGVWGAFLLLLALAGAPVFSTVLPPLFDYPNHLARMHLLAEGGDEFYALSWAPLPNLAEDLIVPVLARAVPLEIAGKLFLVSIFILIAGGALCLNRAITGKWRYWPLLVFLLLYNRIFLWGFLNYLLGVGIALCGAALWLALERHRVSLRIFASSLVALACFFSHIAAFGVYALTVIGMEAPLALGEFGRRRWQALSRRCLIAGAQFVVPAALFLGWRQHAFDGTVSHAGFWRKPDLLFNVLDNYNRSFDIACFALFVVLIGGLAVTGRLGLAPRLAWAMGLLFVLYLALPSQLYGGSGADHRLPVVLFLLLIAGSAPRFPSRTAAIAVATAAAVMLSARMAVIEGVWRRADQVYAADLAGLDKLPKGARLAVAYSPDAIHVVRTPEVHLPAMAVVRRDAFVPTLFAIPGQQPISLRPAYAALKEEAEPQQLWNALVAADDARRERLAPALKQFDAVALIGRRPFGVEPNRCLRPMLERPTFKILALVHDPDCSGS